MWKQISSLQHPLVKHWVLLRKNSDYRYDHGHLLIEGKKIIAELAVNHRFKTLIATDESLIPQGVKADEILITTENVMKKISGMETPEGIVAEMTIPEKASLQGVDRLLVLDKLADPGNIGTLLRTALALGWQGVFFIEGGCDPFNEKVLRAARGATFELKLGWGKWEEIHTLLSKGEYEMMAADLKGEDLAKVSTNKKVALIVGNEAQGISEEVKRHCRLVTIPMPGKVESLNVSIAGGIMMYLLRVK